MNSQRPEDLGVLTHAIVATLAGEVHRLAPYELARTAYETARDTFGPHHMRNRTQALLIEATSFASMYLRTYVPPQPWRLVAAEHPTGTGDEAGRVDLVWEHPELGVLFDEIKTTKMGTDEVAPRWRGQCQRYVVCGRDEVGARFIGVRLIPLGALHITTFFAAAGGSVPLASTPWHPSRLASASVGSQA